MSIVDEISPATYGEDRIDLALATESPRAFNLVVVDVAISRALPEGLVLPLKMTVAGPSGLLSTQTRTFTRFIPAQLTFRPIEGGATLVMLSELFHNRWFGKLVIDVDGDQLER